MQQLIVGNWKMHGLASDAVALARAVASGARDITPDLLVCPTALHVSAVAQALHGTAVATGGQDCHQDRQGAHTGDIAAAMLRDAGATWVILGHSERRLNHFETDALVLAKTVAATQAGLTPIVCIGETGEERGAGQEQDVVARQIAGSLPQPFTGVVAYEPVWAIGTGKTPTERDVAIMHGFIRGQLVRHLGDAGKAVRILYGGSVRPGNAATLLGLPDVAGALVGGASLKAEDFLGIAHAASFPPIGSA